VFLSYASQDAGAAEQIAASLRDAGLEVWFDRSELRGGDAWDHQIRRQIHECALFLAIISAHSDARDEGYFRREWKLAVERSDDMAEDVAFLVPVVVDSTQEAVARVPDRFRDVQWSRAPVGHASPILVEHVRRLLSAKSTPSATQHRLPATTARRASLPNRSPSGALPWIVVLLAVAAGYSAIDRFMLSTRSGGNARAVPAAQPTSSTPETPAARFSPPPHSVAVLPFANLSGDSHQEYFSDGLTEELLNSLTRINELQVAARTSSFYFKGEHADLSTIARKLNVAAVLEGSVRRSGNKVRVTAQLINAITGFHLWSETYDRDLSDVLKLQTDIANAVAGALKITILGDTATKIELGGTRNPAALDAYLRAEKLHADAHTGKDYQNAIAAYSEAIRLDPGYALALSARSFAFTEYFGGYAAGQGGGFDNLSKAEADARRAVALAPELAQAHLSLAFAVDWKLNFASAYEEYERARALAPGDAKILRTYGEFAISMGRYDSGISDLRRALVLDPLNGRSHRALGVGLFLSRRYEESIGVLQDTLALDRNDPTAYGTRGMDYYLLGQFQKARDSCAVKPDDWQSLVCLAIAYDKLGKRSDAEAALGKLRTSGGDDYAVQYAEIYAQWGSMPKALEALETALRLRDPGLESIKIDPLLDSLRNNSRFQVIEKALSFPM
jgi:TolB-like protein/Flp pilus assembly protein TadD